MKAHHVTGLVLAVVTGTAVWLEATHIPAVFAVVVVALVAFGVAVVRIERREWAAQDERDRMAASIERERRRVELCDTGPREPTHYRDGIEW